MTVQSNGNPYAHCLAKMELGWTVVTGHDRLARHLRRRYAEIQALDNLDAGGAWASPIVLTESTWLRESYEMAALGAPLDQSLPLLLSDRQSNMLWGQEIQQDRLEQAQSSGRKPQDLLGARGAADLARNARRILKRLGQQPWDPALHYNSDPAAFRRYLTRVETRLKRNHWVELADVPGILLKLINDPQFPREFLPPSGRILFAGFTEDWPELRALVQALKGEFHEDPTLHQGEPKASSAKITAVPVPDLNAETDAACEWAVERLKAWMDGSRDSPLPPRIGIAVLHPGIRMTRFERVLMHLLDAEGLTLQAGSTDFDPRRHAFSTQYPRPLRSHSLIRVALTLLSLNRDQVRSPDLSEILLSPFLRIAGRQRFRLLNEEPRLRENWPLVLPWDQAFGDLESRGINHAGRILGEILELPGMQDHPRPLAQWAEDWSHILSKAGWPRGAGEGLDSATYQVTEKLQQLLMELGTMDLVSDHHPNRAQALEQLAGMLGSTQFQLEGSGGPIEVFDLEESAGLEFDALFLCGLVDESWPPVPTANHFLPIEELTSPKNGGRSATDCPKATASSARQHAERLTQHLLNCAREVMIGLPQSDGQSGRVLRPSVLLPAKALTGSSRSEQQPMNPMGWALAPKLVAASLAQQLEHSTESPLPISQDEAQRVTGGAYLLQAQAHCPVRAQLRYRLGLRPLTQPELGMTALVGGTTFHKAIELFWKKLPGTLGHSAQTQATYGMLLSVLSADNSPEPRMTGWNETGQKLGLECILESLKDPGVSGTFTALPDAYRSLICQRYLDLLEKWMIKEFDEPFQAVDALEMRANWQYQGIKLSLKVDRIQRDADGTRELIDYKGSSKRPFPSWVGMRPYEPQLPLYAVLSQQDGHPVSRLAFGVYGDKPKWVNLSADSFPSRAPSESEILAEMVGLEILCPSDLAAKILKTPDSTWDTVGAFTQIRAQFEPMVQGLLDGYISGSPILDPLPAPGSKSRSRVDDLVCTTCDFQDVCRIREYLAGAGEGIEEPELELDEDGTTP